MHVHCPFHVITAQWARPLSFSFFFFFSLSRLFYSLSCCFATDMDRASARETDREEQESEGRHGSLLDQISAFVGVPRCSVLSLLLGP